MKKDKKIEKNSKDVEMYKTPKNIYFGKKKFKPQKLLFKNIKKRKKKKKCYRRL